MPKAVGDVAFHVITIFPQIFESFLQTSLVGKAIAGRRISVGFVDPRDFTEDRHRSVDDTPYGGGEGMVMKPEPLVAAMESVVSTTGTRPHRVLLTPQGQPLTQRHLARLARQTQVVLVCGRYEGFDERVRGFVDQELSLGDFVLNGGEVAAMAVIDAVARLIPGVIGNPASLGSESHEGGLLEYPQYTRPRSFRGEKVPDVLVEGDHARIAAWRQTQRLLRTRARRPDLWRGYRPTDEDRRLLAQHGSQPPGLAGRTYLALLHHPVYDRVGRVVTTAITNLDLHDIARAARTYGLAGYFVVTPLSSQRELAGRIIGHWREGHGAVVNEKRREALSLVEVTDTLQAARATVAQRWGRDPQVVATTAKARAGQLSPDRLRARLPTDAPLLLVLGTGWGLTDEIIDNSHAVLEPLDPKTGYNHLSVRSAAAIILDRLFSMSD